MPRPIEERYIVPCAKCGYHYPRKKMIEDDMTSTGWICNDQLRCNGNRARQQRYKDERKL